MRYQVPLPSDQVGGHSAFTPGLTRYAASGAQMYKGAVSGNPGTLGVPAPTRNTVPSGDVGDLTQAGYARSSDAPDVWYPQKYYERSLDGDGTMGFVNPVRIFSDDIMPVPAVDPRGLPALMAMSAVQPRGLGANAEIPLIPAVPHWAQV